MPYRVNPSPNSVSHASTFPAGATSFQVSAQEGSYVAISQNNVLKGVALVPASGSVSVPVTAGITSGQVRIVVTKPQRQPYIQDINVGGAPQTFTITVSANPTIGGTVTGGGNYQQNASCTVRATVNNGYTFSNWTENGNVVSTQAIYTFTVTSNRNLVANFTAAPQNYTIAVSANPTQGGTVTGGGTYPAGQSCTVAATANNGYVFANWTENGNVVSTNARYTFTVNGNRTLVANFTQQNYTISVSANPNNGGTVTGGGAFHYGDNCTVSATPAAGYTFLRWTENGNQVSNNATYTFTVTGNRTLVAQFQAQTYTITATADPANGGTVTGGGTFTYGQSCTLTATPATGYTFINWTKNGQQVSTNATYTFNVTESAAFVAHFQVQSFTINVSSNPNNGGTVAGGGTYTYGQNCTVSATPTQRYIFVNWTENCTPVSTNATYSFVVNANRNLVANFEGEPIDIKVNIDPADAADVTGEGVYHYGDQVTLTVEPYDNYLFQNWTEDGIVVCETMTYTFTATDSRTLTANLINTEGVDENSDKATIYPNPVNDKIHFEGLEGEHEIQIYNAFGMLVMTTTLQGNSEINICDLPTGYYLIRIDNRQSVKFIKE